jgi:hypothetical protein
MTEFAPPLDDRSLRVAQCGPLTREVAMRTSVACVLVTAAVYVGNPVHAEEPSTDEEVVDALGAAEVVVGEYTSDAVVSHDESSAVVLVESGTSIAVPVDPEDGIAVDSRRGVDATVVPTDVQLGQFEQTYGPIAVAAAPAYVSIAEPLEGGDLRLAVVLTDADAPTTLSYEFRLDEGLTVTPRLDGGFDFVDAEGIVQGGLAAPWAFDANDNPVEVQYAFAGDVLTRTLTITPSTAFPVVTNWCLLGKNPNGSCRGSSVAKRVVYDTGWFVAGAAVCGPIGAATGGAAAAACGAAVWAVRVGTESAARRHP